MKMQVRWAALFAVLALLIGMAGLQAGGPEPAVKKTFEKLIAAIKTADRDAFVADATDAVKAGTKQEVMDALKKDLGPRFDKGYTATYLCQLKQDGHRVHLWKMTFKDDGDDMLFRVILKDGKVAGFFLR